MDSKFLFLSCLISERSGFFIFTFPNKTGAKPIILNLCTFLRNTSIKRIPNFQFFFKFTTWERILDFDCAQKYQKLSGFFFLFPGFCLHSKFLIGFGTESVFVLLSKIPHQNGFLIFIYLNFEAEQDPDFLNLRFL